LRSHKVSPALTGAPALTGTSVRAGVYGSADQSRVSIRPASSTASSVFQGCAALPSPLSLPWTGST
jgi:hypothetical protein